MVKSKKLYKILGYLLLLLMGVYLIWYCFRDITLSNFVEHLKEVNVYLILLSMLVGAIIPFLLRSLRWKMLIEAVNYTPTTKNVYNSLMVGFITNIILPRAGEISRCASLSKTDNIPFDKLIGTVVIERTIDVLCLLFAIFLTLILRLQFFKTFFYEHIAVRSFSFYPVLYLFLALLFLSLLFLLIWKLVSLKVKDKVKTVFQGIVSGVKSILALKNYRKFLLYTILIWICFWLTSYITLQAIPATSMLNGKDALFLMVVGSLAWLVPLPGGIGTFHFSVAFGLQLYGLTQEEGVVFATISHESQLIITLILGLIALISIAGTRRLKE